MLITAHTIKKTIPRLSAMTMSRDMFFSGLPKQFFRYDYVFSGLVFDYTLTRSTHRISVTERIFIIQVPFGRTLSIESAL